MWDFSLNLMYSTTSDFPHYDRLIQVRNGSLRSAERDKPVFNLLDGTFQKVETNNDCISDENVAVLQQLLGTDFDSLTAIKLNQKARSGFLLMMIKYYEIHLQGFHKPKSLAVLNEIYS